MRVYERFSQTRWCPLYRSLTVSVIIIIYLLLLLLLLLTLLLFSEIFKILQLAIQNKLTIT